MPHFDDLQKELNEALTGKKDTLEPFDSLTSPYDDVLFSLFRS